MVAEYVLEEAGKAGEKKGSLEHCYLVHVSLIGNLEMKNLVSFSGSVITPLIPAIINDHTENTLLLSLIFVISL